MKNFCCVCSWRSFKNNFPPPPPATSRLLSDITRRRAAYLDDFDETSSPATLVTDRQFAAKSRACQVGVGLLGSSVSSGECLFVRYRRSGSTRTLTRSVPRRCTLPIPGTKLRSSCCTFPTSVRRSRSSCRRCTTARRKVRGRPRRRRRPWEQRVQIRDPPQSRNPAFDPVRNLPEGSSQSSNGGAAVP